MNAPISPIFWSPLPAITIEFAACFSDPVFLAIIEQSRLTASSLETLLVSNIQSAFETGRESLNNSGPLMAAIGALFPGPNLRVPVAFLCSESGHEVGGIWLIPFVHSVAELNSVNILPDGEEFAFEFPAATIQSFLTAVWRALQQTNRRLDQDGTLDPTGPLEITEAPTISSPTQTTIQLVVKGTYHWSEYGIHEDVNFTLTNTETLSVITLPGGLTQVSSSGKNKLELDQTKVSEIQAALALGMISLGGDFVVVQAVLQQEILDGIANAKNRVPNVFDLGGTLASFLPSQFLIQGSTKKIVLPYDQVNCDLSPDGSGITVSGGLPHPVSRTPSMQLAGSVEILVNRATNHDVMIPATYYLVLNDLTDIVTYAWEEDGAPVSAAPVYQPVFDVSGMKINQTKIVEISASVIDNADMTASASISVKIVIVNIPQQKPSRGGILKQGLPVNGD